MKGTSLFRLGFEVLPSVLLCVLFAGVGVMHVTSRVMGVRAAYELSRAEQTERELAREHDRLKLELATLKSPVRLEQLAREQLHMAPPAAGTVITLRAAPAAPATTLARRDVEP